jgi:hypothetical protein
MIMGCLDTSGGPGRRPQLAELRMLRSGSHGPANPLQAAGRGSATTSRASHVHGWVKACTNLQCSRTCVRGQ